MRPASTAATLHATAYSRMRSASTSRRSAGNSFESRSPRRRYAGSRITAAATTHPNSEPRPTSSTPATSFAPDSHARFSYRNVHRSLFSRRSLAADADNVRADGDLIAEAKGLVHHLRRDEVVDARRRFANHWQRLSAARLNRSTFHNSQVPP